MNRTGTKERLLAILERGRGSDTSGESIARQLGISRSAVWKAVNALKKDGYKIDALPNRGYCLCMDNDILSVQGILPFLSRADFSQHIHLYDSLESTNKTAKEMALAGAAHGTLVLAESQTAGRGRYGRSFHSPPGHGIYMTVILHTARLCFAAPSLATAFAAVSVCEAVESVSGKKPQIKWVNDLYLDGKKICGILTEAVTDFESGSIPWIVIGIGVNFSTPAEDYPEGVRQVVGAVFAQDDPPTTRNHLAAEIVNRVLSSCERRSEKEILAGYKQRLMMLGEEIQVIGTNESYDAVAIDIDDMGRLIVKTADGALVSLSSGEISVRAKQNVNQNTN